MKIPVLAGLLSRKSRTTRRGGAGISGSHNGRRRPARARVLCALLLTMAGCAKPPKIAATMDISRRTPDTVLISLRIENLEDHATTPIAPEVMVQTRTGGAWDKPASQIHPAAFVLNKRELRSIVKVLHTNADLVRATLTIKEQENGHVLMNQRMEKPVPLETAK